jgi:hypothetical protein
MQGYCQCISEEKSFTDYKDKNKNKPASCWELNFVKLAWVLGCQAPSLDILISWIWINVRRVDRPAQHGLYHHLRCPLCESCWRWCTISSSSVTSLGKFGTECSPGCAWHAHHRPLTPCTSTGRSPQGRTPLKMLYKGLAYVTLLMPWMIRKRRNNYIFERAHLYMLVP